jgi:hypothetical protein
MTRIRKSIPTEGASMWWSSGWSYVMPDFDKPNHSIIEWLSENPPVYPHRVPETTNTENANDSDNRRQQPA